MAHVNIFEKVGHEIFKKGFPSDMNLSIFDLSSRGNHYPYPSSINNEIRGSHTNKYQIQRSRKVPNLMP